MDKNRPSRFLRQQTVVQLFRTSPKSFDRKPASSGFSFADLSSREEAIRALQSHLLNEWSGLSSAGRDALDFAPQSQFSEEEDGLTHLAYLLIDCANRTLEEAVAVRRRRLMDSM